MAETPVVIEVRPDPLDGGYVASCRDEPGCFGQGETAEEAFADAADALAGIRAMRDEQDDDTPAAVWSGELTMCGVTLHVHVLGNGMRIIDADDFRAFWQAVESGTALRPTEAEVAAFARWQNGGEPT